jgi:pyruvate dehydrogenase E2 component (dihydrolipoamide acetyltransferase)
MELGKIIEWKAKVGDRVSEGDVLAEVESDKAVMELECFRDGVIAEILHGDGDEVPVGEVIATIALEGDEAPGGSALEAAAGEAAEEAQVAAALEPVGAEPAGPPAEPVEVAQRRPEGERVAISPYARKLAEQKGVDYTRLAGTGPGGRILARDVERASAGATLASEPAARPAAVQQPVPPAAPPRPSPDEELPALDVTEDEAEVEDAPFRLKTQAQRVIASQHVIPHFYVTRGIDVSDLLARREELKRELGATVTHLVMFACLRALRDHPEINRSYDRGKIIKWKGVNLGLAVDTDEGLTVAVLRNAQDLSLREVVERASGLVERARAGRLSAEERRHATFTITSLGMFDVEHFEPIINPPSSVTLAVSSALPAPLVKGDAIHIGKVMKLTAACDHRIIDGAAAACFLADVRRLLEEPAELLAEL